MFSGLRYFPITQTGQSYTGFHIIIALPIQMLTNSTKKLSIISCGADFFFSIRLLGGFFPRQTGHMLVESLYLHAANRFHICGHEWQSNVLSWPGAICIDNELEINWFWNCWHREQLALLPLICWCNADGLVNTSVVVCVKVPSCETNGFTFTDRIAICCVEPHVSGDADELHWIWY